MSGHKIPIEFQKLIDDHLLVTFTIELLVNPFLLPCGPNFPYQNGWVIIFFDRQDYIARNG